ncbi:MAG: hypothetical protein KJO79_02180, partial [Verrucomicrobiae bacterium]|nr:hypothetical protein [Verrucomicrobiae bacterium]NNJ85961.1 hypothetical protein [Akkermansiaceae bacterium]
MNQEFAACSIPYRWQHLLQSLEIMQFVKRLHKLGKVPVMLTAAFCLGGTAIAADTSQPAPAAQPASAGEKATPSQPSAGSDASLPSVSSVEAQIAAIEKDGNLQEAAKQALISKYQDALKFLKQATANRASAVEFTEAAQSDPRKAAELTRQLEKLPSPEQAAKVEPSATTEQLDKEVKLRQASVADLERQLESVQSALSKITERPAEIGVRLPKAREELKAAENELGLLGKEDADSASRAADRTRLTALQAA